MALFAWDSSFSVGVPAIDVQHQRLIAMINELHAAMLSGTGRDAVEPILAGLIRYTSVHFSAEEELMKARGYPAFEEHRRDHVKLTAEVRDLYRKFQSGNIGLTLPTMIFLRDWLKNHILSTDMKYRPYFARKEEKIPAIK